MVDIGLQNDRVRYYTALVFLYIGQDRKTTDLSIVTTGLFIQASFFLLNFKYLTQHLNK